MKKIPVKLDKKSRPVAMDVEASRLAGFSVPCDWLPGSIPDEVSAMDVAKIAVHLAPLYQDPSGACQLAVRLIRAATHELQMARHLDNTVETRHENRERGRAFWEKVRQEILRKTNTEKLDFDPPKGTPVERQESDGPTLVLSIKEVGELTGAASSTLYDRVANYIESRIKCEPDENKEASRSAWDEYLKKRGFDTSHLLSFASSWPSLLEALEECGGNDGYVQSQVEVPKKKPARKKPKKIG